MRGGEDGVRREWDELSLRAAVVKGLVDDLRGHLSALTVRAIGRVMRMVFVPGTEWRKDCSGQKRVRRMEVVRTEVRTDPVKVFVVRYCTQKFQ